MATCIHCGREIVFDPTDGWVDPEATGDDSVWRETCDEHDTFEARNEPESKTVTIWHDANGFPHDLPNPVNFTLEESDTWYCKVCEEDVDGDVDNRGHRFDGKTAEQIWTAVPLDPDGHGDVWSGSFEDALAYFIESFSTEEEN